MNIFENVSFYRMIEEKFNYLFELKVIFNNQLIDLDDIL